MLDLYKAQNTGQIEKNQFWIRYVFLLFFLEAVIISYLIEGENCV
jgi:hypothetical protein